MQPALEHHVECMVLWYSTKGGNDIDAICSSVPVRNEIQRATGGWPIMGYAGHTCVYSALVSVCMLRWLHTHSLLRRRHPPNCLVEVRRHEPSGMDTHAVAEHMDAVPTAFDGIYVPNNSHIDVPAHGFVFYRVRADALDAVRSCTTSDATHGGHADHWEEANMIIDNEILRMPTVDLRTSIDTWTKKPLDRERVVSGSIMGYFNKGAPPPLSEHRCVISPIAVSETAAATNNSSKRGRFELDGAAGTTQNMPTDTHRHRHTNTHAHAHEYSWRRWIGGGGRRSWREREYCCRCACVKDPLFVQVVCDARAYTRTHTCTHTRAYTRTHTYTQARAAGQRA